MKNDTGLRNVPSILDDSLFDQGHYFDFHSVRLCSFTRTNTKNVYMSLKSMGTQLVNQLEMNVTQSVERDDFRANHTKEELEIESGIILKKYGKVLMCMLAKKHQFCFICILGRYEPKISPEYNIIHTNLLRKYYPISIRKITMKYIQLCKIMFFDLNKAISKAKNRNGELESAAQSGETNSEDLYSKRVDQLSKDEIYSFRKYLVDLDEIRYDEKKEFLFGFHTIQDYNELFETYYRINQFNLIRPRLHVNEVTKIQKSKYDLMWKLRQKILRHLVTKESESFVLNINVSQLDGYQPNKTHIREILGPSSQGTRIYFCSSKEFEC